MPARAVNPVFFVPGGAGDASFWAPVARRLPTGSCHVLLASPTEADPASPYRGARSYVDVADRVAARIADAGTGPADLVGQSMGCLVAALLALRHPQLVRRMVLAGMAAGIDLPRHGGTDWTGGYAKQHPTVPSWITTDIPDITADLGRITAPTLLAWGAEDAVSPVAVAAALAAAMPNARLVVVDGGHHDFPARLVARTAELVTRHLRPDEPAGSRSTSPQVEEDRSCHSP